MEGLEGTKIDRYRIERLLGAGGMGAVYAAVQEPLGRPVAVKVLRRELASDASIVARFKREAELAASLHHPGIAQVTDFGIADGRAFLVMDLLAGESLAQWLEREGTLSAARVQRIAAQVLAALAVAHERGIVHRDLKPENVFVQRVGGMELVKLLDFGIARLIEADVKMTSTGAVLGTPAYMSPEQARGRPCDARSDLFSLGTMLYEMLAGRRAFSGQSYHELMFAVVEETPPALETVRPGIDPALVALVARAMEKSPDARFATAREMASTLAEIELADAASTRPDGGSDLPPTREVSARALAPTAPSEPRPAPRARSRGRIAAAIGIAIAIAGAVALGGSLRTAEQSAVRTSIPGPASAPPAEATVAIETRPGSASAPPAEAMVAIETRPGSASALPAEAMVAIEARPATSAAATQRVPDAGTAIAAMPAIATATATSATEAREAREETAQSARVAATAVRVQCGPRRDDVRELPIVRARDGVVVTSLGTHGGARAALGTVRAAVNTRSAELAACFRGHGLLPGQAFTLHVDEAGAVQRVETQAWCPVEPRVAACAERVLGSLMLPNTGAAGAFRIGLDRSR